MEIDNYRRNPNYRPGATRDLTNESSRDTRKWIADVLHDDDRAVNDASVGLVYDYIAEKYRRDFTKVDYVRKATEALNLPNNDGLWREVFANNPDLDTGASRAAVKALSHEHRLPFDVPNLRRALQRVIENNPEQLLLTPEATKRQRQLEQRTRRINEITNNYTSGFKIRSPHGVYSKRVFDKDGYEVQFSSNGTGRIKPRGGGFDAMTDDEVQAIYEEVMEERRLQSLSPAELRAEINPVRQQKLEASSTSLGPNPAGTQLINPDNGQVIDTKRDLIRFINQHQDNTKRLLYRNGATDRTLARRFEEILNS